MDKDKHLEIPADMRAMAEKSVEQARIAFNTFMSATQDAVARFEGHAMAAQAGAKDISGKALHYAEKNVSNTFAFADRLVQAKDVQEIIRLQNEFVQEQMKELADQAKQLSDAATRMAMKSVKT
jgi:phasin